MTDQSTREQQIADLRSLVDFLAAHPDLPIGNNGIGRQCVLAADDETGIAEIRRIADILGADVDTDGSSIDTCRMFGALPYRAFYCTRETMRQHHEELQVVAEYRKGARAVES